MLLWVSIARGEVFYGVTVNGIFKVDATTGTFSGGTYATVVKFATPISFAATLATSPSCTVTTGPGKRCYGVGSMEYYRQRGSWYRFDRAFSS